MCRAPRALRRPRHGRGPQHPRRAHRALPRAVPVPPARARAGRRRRLPVHPRAGRCHPPPAEVSGQLFHTLEELAPFGRMNPEPVFLFDRVTYTRPAQFFGRNHVKLFVRGQGRRSRRSASASASTTGRSCPRSSPARSTGTTTATASRCASSTGRGADAHAALAALLDLVFPRRLRRISHILRFVLCNALLVWLLLDASAGDHVSALLFFVVLLYFILFRLLPRARDAGLPAGGCCFNLVPALNIILVYALFSAAPPCAPRPWKRMPRPSRRCRHDRPRPSMIRNSLPRCALVLAAAALPLAACARKIEAPAPAAPPVVQVAEAVPLERRSSRRRSRRSRARRDAGARARCRPSHQTGLRRRRRGEKRRCALPHRHEDLHPELDTTRADGIHVARAAAGRAPTT
ncbi:MAG: hypothetical protein WDO13_08630 [Verrucomicrobiota bacterium]